MENTHQPFEMTESGILRISDGELLANFTAKIVKEVRYKDGKETKTNLIISGTHRGEDLPEITIEAATFMQMNWITQYWGVTTLIAPIRNAERDARAAIQLTSEPKKLTIHTHTGWTTIKKKRVYLTKTGAVHAKGIDKSVIVELPQGLHRYAINAVNDPKPAITHSLRLINLAPPRLAWGLFAAIFRPTLERTDYALHVAGQTGTFKSEVTSLMQSHYGEEMDARHLPASWSSTANAIEAQAYKTKDALMVIDDFVPFGTSYQVRQLQKTADSVFRGQGNQAGRSRLTDVSSFQQTMYPRGMIISSGEDIPQGHSIRARMVIIDLSPGDINKQELTHAQQARQLYQYTTAAWLRHLANDWDQIAKVHKARRHSLMAENADIGHSRTPAILGDQIATIEAFLEFAAGAGAISSEHAMKLMKQGADALKLLALDQEQFLKDTDPTETYIQTLGIVFDSGVGHLKTCSGGIPEQATELGWTQKQTVAGEITTYAPQGTQLGWINPETDEMLIDPNLSWPTIQKAARGSLTITKQTMSKRLKDAGLLTRTDARGSRNTVRATCEGRTRNVIAISFSRIAESKEK